MHPTPNLISGELAEPTPADILRGAAIYLQQHGWTQNDYYTTNPVTGEWVDEFPPACHAGAIAIAICGRTTVADDRTEAETRLYNQTLDFYDDHLRLIDPGFFTTCDCDDRPGLFGWNDYPYRVLPQVVAALNAAADAWDRTHLHMTGGGR